MRKHNIYFKYGSFAQFCSSRDNAIPAITLRLSAIAPFISASNLSMCSSSSPTAPSSAAENNQQDLKCQNECCQNRAFTGSEFHQQLLPPPLQQHVLLSWRGRLQLDGALWRYAPLVLLHPMRRPAKHTVSSTQAWPFRDATSSGCTLTAVSNSNVLMLSHFALVCLHACWQPVYYYACWQQ